MGLETVPGQEVSCNHVSMLIDIYQDGPIMEYEQGGFSLRSLFSIFTFDIFTALVTSKRHIVICVMNLYLMK